jgi:hypothetical protein
MEQGTALSEKITPQDVQELVARMANLPEPSAQQLAAVARRFSPDDLANRMNQKLDRKPSTRKPKRPSITSLITAGFKAAEKAGIENPTVEVDGVMVSAGKPTPKNTAAPKLDKWLEKNAR